jgi:predicted Na+-dependent transporter
MNAAAVIVLVLQISIAVIVFSLALGAAPGELGFLLKRPSLLLRSILAMNVIMPIVAGSLAKLFRLNQDVEMALILLAVAPVPPILPGKQAKAGADMSYGVSLLFIAALLSIVAVPLSMSVVGKWFGLDVHVPMSAIAKVVGISVLGPLVLGAAIVRLIPGAARLAKPLSKIALVILVVGLVPVLFVMRQAIWAEVGNLTLVAIVVFTLVGLVVGHLLGGPKPENRTVLALATACRHPGVAVTIASSLVDDKKPVIAAVLLCVLTAAVVTTPYVKARKKAQAA